MRIIMREWLKNPKAFALMALHVVMSIVYNALNAWVIVLIANVLSNPEDYVPHLTKLLIVCGVQIVLGPVKKYVRSLSRRQGFSTVNNAYADKVLDADVEMFTKYSTSYIQRQLEYIGKISDAHSATAQFVIDITYIITVLVSMYLVAGNMTFWVIVVYGVGAIIFRWLFSIYEKMDSAINGLFRIRNQEIEDTINGFMEVRSFGTQEYHRRRIRHFNEQVYDMGTKRARLNAWTDAAFEGVDTLGMTVVIFFAIQQLLSGAITQATAMSMVMYVFRIIQPLSAVLDYLDVISEKKSGAKDYDAIASYQNTTRPGGDIRMDKFEDKIELRHVGFSYTNSSAVLRDVNMTIEKGTKVGICGTSGAGKSTLFKVLNRFYDESHGQILIDGIDIHDIDTKSYREHIASVHQENSIFPGSIKMNVLYGSEHATEYEMIEACKKARIYDFIMGLPEKFDTIVGPRGLTLSGGQKQRISLARLFLRDPDIILLDEATSALDNESETFIQDAIDALPGKTIITIAHRLSTIQNSDIIYVMGNGTVLEKGTHEELLAKHGAYYAMQK